MAHVRIDAGACGFITRVNGTSDDGQHVEIAIRSDCPHVERAAEDLKSLDAFSELFTKVASTRTYAVLSEHLPHPTCPVYSGVLKAVEAAAGLALPKDATITITLDQPEENDK